MGLRRRDTAYAARGRAHVPSGTATASGLGGTATASAPGGTATASVPGRRTVSRVTTRRIGGLAAVALAGSALVGCSAGAQPAAHSANVEIVASTNAWGAVAKAVGGNHVAVTSVIAAPDQDPHTYEVSARTLLAVDHADLIIENGGGYDDFMGQMIDSSGSSAPVVDAVAVSGVHAPAGGPLNEHVWYDFAGVERVAHAVADRLTALRPAYAAQFHANLARFDSRVDDLIAQARRVGAAHPGAAVAITEPVPGYLLATMGLRDLTPPAFSEAVEEGGDVSTRVLADTLDLFTQHRVEALVYNAQATSAVTERVEAAARDAGVPVVPVTETMPLGDTYVGWMHRNITALAAALGRS